MSSPLSQDLAAKIIEVLVQRGHVLLSKGGRPALVREVADRINDTLATIVGRMPPPGIVENEVTSTFGDESLDDTVEEMVEDITASLMDSDHVEDVFSEDAVIRRDVFRVVKDTLLSSDHAWTESEEADVEVNLESLGYIASKAAQRAGKAMVEDALSRAARASQAKLLKYSPETQTATFRAALASPDARLELEEAVADELGNLVDEGKVALPTIERRVAIGRTTAPAERSAARTAIDVAASKTLLRSGCTATWEFAGQDAIVVSLVPMSEQDGRTVDPHVDAFTREVQSIFARGRTAAEPAAGLDAWLQLAREIRSGEPKAKPAEKKAPAEEKAPTSKKAAREAAPSSKRAAETTPASKRAAEAAPASRKAARKPEEEEAPAPKKAAAPKRKAAAREASPAAKKATAKKSAEKKAKPETVKKAVEKKARPAEKVTAAAAKKVTAAGKAAKAAPKVAKKKPVRR